MRMISRRNYIIISIMMAVLFVLFQFSLVMKDSENDYSTNPYISETKLTAEDVWQPSVFHEPGEVTDKAYAVFIGDEASEVYHTVLQWCSFRKMNLFMQGSLTEYKKVRCKTDPKVILIDGSILRAFGDAAAIEKLEQGSVPLIFCTLPDAAELQKNERFAALFGISGMLSDDEPLCGIHLFSGFLLGGEQVYRMDTKGSEDYMDFSLDFPRYYVFSGAKVYMLGMFEKTPKNTELQPPLIWRYGTHGNFIFAVNGDFLKDDSGIGILNGMMAEAHPFDVYPVVNAQMLSLVNYPCLAEENEAQIQAIYSRSLSRVLDDLVWPNLLAVFEGSGFHPTCYMAAKFDYESGAKPSGSRLLFYLKQLQEQQGEAGLSLKPFSDGGMEEKLRADTEFFGNAAEGYPFAAAYLGADAAAVASECADADIFQNVSTVTGSPEGSYFVLDYLGNDTLLLSFTSDTINYKYSDDLKLRGYMTGIGYCNAFFDMYSIAYPKETADEWQHVAKVFSANAMTFWKPFKNFDHLTASETAGRARRFLALDYTAEQSGDTISIGLSGMEEEAWLLLRLHSRQVISCEGAEASKVEEDVYLLRAWQEQITVETESTELANIIE